MLQWKTGAISEFLLAPFRRCSDEHTFLRNGAGAVQLSLGNLGRAQTHGVHMNVFLILDPQHTQVQGHSRREIAQTHHTDKLHDSWS